MSTRAREEERRVQVRRRFPAPREKVFAAWTEEAALRQWFSPQGYSCDLAEVDLRPGGPWRVGMRRLEDGQLFTVAGVFEEVSPPARLVYTWAWQSPEADETDTRVTVEFLEGEGETEIVLTHERFTSAEQAAEHDKGWNGCLDRLTEYVA